MSNLALIYASTGPGKFCHPSMAIRLAKKGSELNGYKDSRVLATLATAYASDKKYLQAIMIAKKPWALQRLQIIKNWPWK